MMALMEQGRDLANFATRVRAERSFLYFLQWCSIRSSEGGRGKIPFALYDYQQEVAERWEAAYWSDHLDGYVELKARQIGFSWLLAAFLLWATMYHQSSDAGLFSKAAE